MVLYVNNSYSITHKWLCVRLRFGKIASPTNKFIPNTYFFKIKIQFSLMQDISISFIS